MVRFFLKKKYTEQKQEIYEHILFPQEINRLGTLPNFLFGHMPVKICTETRSNKTWFQI